MRSLALILLMVPSTCLSATAVIYPSSHNPDVLLIEGSERTQCDSTPVNFVIERDGTVLRAYGRNRGSCFNKERFRDQFSLASRCVGDNPCEGPVTAIEVRVVDLANCEFTSNLVPECARIVTPESVHYRQPIYYKAPVYQSHQLHTNGVLLERRSGGVLSIDLVNVPESYTLRLSGIDSLYSVLSAADGQTLRFARFDALRSTLFDTNGNETDSVFVHSDGRRVAAYSINDPDFIDPIRAGGQFNVVNSTIAARSFTVDKCTPPVEDSFEVFCRILVKDQSSGRLECSSQGDCSLTIGSTTLYARIEQLGYDAWFGESKIDFSQPCCTYFRESFAVRVR